MSLRYLPSAVFLVSAVVGPSLWAQASDTTAAKPRTLVTQAIDDSQMVPLPGNVRSAVNASNDRGEVSADFPMEHMLLQLQRPAEQEQALDKFIAEQQDPNSQNYHHWLSPAEYGRRFGLAPEDIRAIREWLQSNGFKVNAVYPSGVLVDFSGTAGNVQAAFHTAIHRLDVNGEQHFANMADPQIPAALAPAVAGIVSLNDFKPHPMNKPRANYTFNSGGSTYYAVTPADLATIYNFTPLFKAGISGKGQTIVVIEDTNVYSTADWTKFRSAFGLSSYTSGSFIQVHPGSCTNPGVVGGNDSEAILDAEYASAAAPNAAIELASCADTNTTFGGLIALENLLNATAKPPAVVSISYGECEAENGASANASYNQTYKQAVTEGVSVFVSSGDEGAASCDVNKSKATHGIGVSGFASTPYNVAVGGTDFIDTYDGTNSTYWSTSNSSVFGSAKSYIPEIPWNDSCAGVLLSTAAGYSTPYGSNGFCNSAIGQYFLTTASGSGGPSGCATGRPAIAGVVSGSCAGYAKPSWQSGVAGIPNDGVRDIPDVSLFAANGLWGHYFVFCWSDTANGGAPCTGAPSSWAGAGGTSFSSPIWAGIQALVNQKTGSRQGLPTPTYYRLAAAQYGGSSAAAIFHDVTQGDMDVNCTGTHNCYVPSGQNGVLSISDKSDSKAYGTTGGWDFATGIGTVNVANLVNHW